MLELIRLLDLSKRIYWYACGRYDVLDIVNIPQPYSGKNTKLQISNFNQFDDLMMVACLPASKVRGLCREILKSLIVEDTSIRLNGKVLKKIEKYFSSKFINKIFETIPDKDLDLSSIILAYDNFDIFVQQLASSLFNYSGVEPLTRTKRFNNHSDLVSLIVELAKQVDLVKYIYEGLPVVIPASYPLLKKIINKEI